jgi:hypothetical protein
MTLTQTDIPRYGLDANVLVAAIVLTSQTPERHALIPIWHALLQHREIFLGLLGIQAPGKSWADARIEFALIRFFHA